MKKKFHGYYRPTKQEFDALWNDALIVLDANVLLNLYTYSLETREEFLRLLDEMKKRIWLPYQVAEEYQRNRCTSIDKAAKPYKDICDKLKDIRNALSSTKGHPYIEADLLKRFDKLCASIEESLDKGQKAHTSLIHADPIRDKLTDIFDGRVGEPFSPEDLEKIYSEGKDRFSKKIPPGYEDEKKTEPEKYGDLVLWKEVLNKASDFGKGVILVTDDAKQDWWHIFNGQKIGPRHELLHEFQAETGKNIYIYSFDSFVQQAKVYGNAVSALALKELEAAKAAREALERRMRENNLAIKNIWAHYDKDQLTFLEQMKMPQIDEATLRALREQIIMPQIDGATLRALGDAIKIPQIDGATLRALRDAIKIAQIDDATLRAHRDAIKNYWLNNIEKKHDFWHDTKETEIGKSFPDDISPEDRDEPKEEDDDQSH